MAEARQNPLSALPAAGAAGVAGLALFAAASSLSPTVVPEGGEYRGLGIGQDGIVRVGFPAGGEQCTNQISRRFSITTCTPSTRRLLDGVAVRFSDRAPPDTLIDLRTGGEVLVPGAPFQPENGYLGMWNWEKQVKPVPKDQTPEAQKALRAAFDAERKKFDVEAQQQGFKSAEARGRRLSFYEASPASPPSYAGPRHRREGENPRREGGGESREGSGQGREGGRGREGGGGGQVRDAGEAGLLRQHQGHRAAVDVRRRRAEEVEFLPQKLYNAS